MSRPGREGRPTPSTHKLQRSTSSPNASRLSPRALPPGTPPTRARVEMRAALEQAEEFYRTPEEPGEWSGYGRCEEARQSTFAPLPPSGFHAQLPVVRVQLAHLD
jgi:hypothetical protein